MAVGDAHAFPGFHTPVLTQLFLPKPPTTFLTCFCGGERRKYAGKKIRLNRGSNSQPPDHESDMLTTEPLGRGTLSRIEFIILVTFNLSSANAFNLDKSHTFKSFTRSKGTSSQMKLTFFRTP